MTDTATTRALGDIDRLADSGFISADLAGRGRFLVHQTFSADTVYATVAPIDDGGLSFYWRGGDWSISVEIGSYDADLWYAIQMSGFDEHRHVSPASQHDYDYLKLALAAFSARAEELNPSWREMKI